MRNWNDVDDGNGDGNEDPKFWEYICNQYALPYDDESFANSHAYKIFRMAINKSLKRHNRLQATSGQKYYTTLLIHAFAPKARFYALFEQIFAFYAATLNYQYVKSDPAFRAFIRAMKLRFESGRAGLEDNVYIKSVQSSSAIRTLFVHCPEYMRTFVERVVCSVDCLVATGMIPEASHLDTLLLGWWESRGRAERAVAKKERSSAGTVRVITEFSNIRVAYRCESGRISLVIPPIRLGEKTDAQPWITIYRHPDDNAPYSEKLGYYGDYFCITSRTAAIALNAIMPENAQRIEPRVVISIGDQVIHDSRSRLYRDFIAFDDSGGERSKRPDREYINLFIAAQGALHGEETSPDYAATPCEGGLLYRVLIDEKTFIRVNAENLFPVERMVSDLTLNISVAPVMNCRYLTGQQECTIFTTPATLTITSENEYVEKQYGLVIDGTPCPLGQYGDRSDRSFRIALPHDKDVHELRIMEHATQQRIYTLHYVVMEDFSLRFNGFYLFDNFSENGFLEISDYRGTSCYPYEILPEKDVMLVPYGEDDLAVELPVLSCHLDGETLSVNDGKIFWYHDIAMSALLEVHVPRGYSGTVVIGQRTFSTTKVELGNEIRANRYAGVEGVGIILRKGNQPPIQIKLFDIAFEPQFKFAPLRAENQNLLWCVEDNYIGDKDSQFKLLIRHRGDEVGSYRVGKDDDIISLDAPLDDGIYEYTVYEKAPGFFSQFEEILDSQFTMGDPAQFKFDDLAVIVTEAILDNERIRLRPASGIITKLQYVGERGLNGEALHYPCYEGYLQFRHDGLLHTYAVKEYERGGILREQINPIRLWLINDYTISLRSPLDDGLYVNKKWESITDRVPVRQADQTIYCNPDYYSFKIITGSEVEHV